MAKTFDIDFSNVKEGGQWSKKRKPAGEYSARVTKADDANAKDGTPQIIFTLKLEGDAGATYPYYCKLQENQLWKLRGLLLAAGLPVPKKRLKVDPNKAVDKLVGVRLEDDEYNGREQSVVDAIFPAAELSDIPSDDEADVPDVDDEAVEDATIDDLAVDDEDEAPAAADEDEDEDDAPAGDDLDALDRVGLKAELKKLDASATVKKSESDDDLRVRVRALRAAPAQGDEDLDELDIDEL